MVDRVSRSSSRDDIIMIHHTMQCVKEFNERDKEWCPDEDVSKETLLKVFRIAEYKCIAEMLIIGMETMIFSKVN